MVIEVTSCHSFPSVPWSLKVLIDPEPIEAKIFSTELVVPEGKGTFYCSWLSIHRMLELETGDHPI